jgi:hypothetical protein
MGRSHRIAAVLGTVAALATIPLGTQLSAIVQLPALVAIVAAAIIVEGYRSRAVVDS